MRHLLFALTFLCSNLIPTFANAESATPPDPVKLPASVFAADWFMDSPALSPNGQFIAARMSTKIGKKFTILPVFNKAIKNIAIDLESSSLTIDSWQWVNDDWLVMQVSATKDVYGQSARVKRLLSVERATGRILKISWGASGQNSSDIVWIANDNRPVVIISTQKISSSNDGLYPEVQEVDVSTGITKTILPSRTGIVQYYSDGRGIVRAGYGYNALNRIAKIIYRSNVNDKFRILGTANLSKGEKITVPTQFLGGTDKAVTGARPNGFGEAFDLDVKSMALGRKIFGVDGYDITGTVPSADGDSVLGFAYDSDRSRIDWIDPEFQKIQRDLDKAVSNSIYIVDWSRNYRVLLVKLGEPNQAGAYYIYNRDDGDKLQRLAYRDEVLKLNRYAPVKTINYRARDGVAISAVLTLPKGVIGKNLPLIVMPHDGPSGRDKEKWDWQTQFLASRGYAVVQPNYRGSTGFGDVFAALGKGQWGLKMQDDLNDAVAHLVSEGIADSNRVCIVGTGYGAYAALRAAQRDGNLFRCSVAYGGIFDLTVRADDREQTLFEKEFTTRLKELAPNFSDVSILQSVKEIKNPVLIMHGKNDLSVPVEQSRKLAAKLKASGKDYRYVEQPLGDHEFTRQEDSTQFLQEMEAFLAKHNPAN
jgi:dipeptidyl aminopeptidase/acylaminoacyl peptidase